MYIDHDTSSGSPNSTISDIVNTGDRIVDDLRESLMETALSILQMLVLFLVT